MEPERKPISPKEPAEREINHLLLHRQDHKEEVYRQTAQIFWSDSLKCWVTCDPHTLREVQQSHDFAVVDQTAQGRKLMARLGLNLGHSERALSALPVSVEGGEHAQRRRDIANLLSLRARGAIDHFCKSSEELCNSLLTTSGRLELIAQFYQPLGLAIAADISGLITPAPGELPSPVQLFDKAMGPTRRKLVNAALGALWHQADERCPAHQRDAAFALAVLGGDTLWASLALSFAQQVAAHPAARLCDIAWPDRLTRTAVPFIERTALADCKIAGQEIKEGDNIRLYLDRFSFEKEESRDAFFGSGRHVCLGRSLAQEAWRGLTASLSKLPSRVDVMTLTYREGDCMFLFPRSLEVMIHAG